MTKRIRGHHPAGGKFRVTVSAQTFKMSICWMFAILLSCGLPRLAESVGTCPCKYQLENVCVFASSTVQVPCPKRNDDEVIFSLIKDKEVISNYTCYNEMNIQNCTSHTLNTTVRVELDKNSEDASVSFILTGVTANSNGSYICEATVVFPPPMIKYLHAPRILVRAEGQQCKHKPDNGDHHTAGGNQIPLWIWIVGLLVLGVYSLIITAISVVSCLRLRRSECQNDYMNTKPRAPNHRRRNKGVQNPIPRHF